MRSLTIVLEGYRWRVTRWAVERVLRSLPDGIAMSLRCAYGDLLRVLVQYVGETGQNEGAVDTLRRIVDDRQRLQTMVIELRRQLQRSEYPTTECKRPPAGWSCSRDADHEGPCAARPASIRNDPFGDGQEKP
jgi:hypothetical protein